MNTPRSGDFYAALTDAGHGPGTQAGVSPSPLDEDVLARLVLTELCGVAHSELGRVVTAQGAAEALRLVLDADDDEFASADFGADLPKSARLAAGDLPNIVKRISDALQQSEAGKLELLTPAHDHWPLSVGDLHSRAPMLLWGRGDTELLTDWRKTGVVGARAATGYGEQVSMEFASALTARDQIIVSGGAYGIEGMAIRAALACDGTPIAVMSGGLERLYPSGHEALLSRVAEKGLLISEQMPQMPPTKWRFMAANRLKAALAHSTVVVEAGTRSGALQTAAQAKLLDRFVGAVPGPLTSAASSGCHALIKDGTAQLVAGVNDIPIVANDPSTGPMQRHITPRPTAQVAHGDPESMRATASPSR